MLEEFDSPENAKRGKDGQAQKFGRSHVQKVQKRGARKRERESHQGALARARRGQSHIG